MRNETKYPQTYLDRLLPDASCPNCTSKSIRREAVRELNGGEHILVTQSCEDCKTLFNVRYDMQYLRTTKQKPLNNREETIKTKPKKSYKAKLIQLKDYTEKKSQGEEVVLDSREKKKMLYNSVSKGFNLMSLVTLVTFIFMESYEIYDFTHNNNIGSITNMIVVLIVMVGILFVTQLLSFIYKIICR